MSWIGSAISAAMPVMQGGMGLPAPAGPPQPYAVDPRSAQMAGLFGQQPGMMPQMRQPGSLRSAQGRMMGGRPGMRPQVQMPGSAGLFDQYMQGGMMPRYKPPAINGIYGDTGRGYSGFLGPQMPKLTLPQAQIPPWIAGLLGGGGQENSPTGVGGVGPGDGTPGGDAGGSGGNSAAGGPGDGGDGTGDGR